MLAVHRGVGTISVPTPPVERAHQLPTGQVPRSTRQLCRPMAARVKEGLDGQVRLADDEDSLIADLVFDEVVRLGNLLQTTGHLPGVCPQLLLELEEAPIEVTLTGHK